MTDIIWPILWVVAGIIFVCFVFVVAFGAPFLPTHKPQVQIAFELIRLQQGQTLVELGSGDGRVLKEAAKRGINAIGYELNPILALYAYFNTFSYRDRVKIICGNYWNQKLPASDAIFVFLMKPYMNRLNQKIMNEAKKPQKLVSYAFTIDSKKPQRTKKGVYLYEYK